MSNRHGTAGGLSWPSPLVCMARSGWVLLLLTSIPLRSQVMWVQRQPALSPTSRTEHALAYDSNRERVVLFGGSINPFAWQVVADTWEWSGTSWSRRQPTVSPPARARHAMTFDVRRGRTVLFGGFVSGGPPLFADTWEWDGNNWTLRTPAVSPPGRYAAGFAHDSTRGVSILFGGVGDPNALGDTWAWDGSNWLQRFPAYAPAATYDHALSFDSSRAVVLLSGGTWTPGTHEWDGNNWTQRFPTNSPLCYASSEATFDPWRGRAVAFTYTSCLATRASQTWEWDGSNWTQVTLPSAPVFRLGSPTVFDSARGTTLLFGGLTFLGGFGSAALLADTWELSPAAVPTAARHGVGCAGSAGTPSLDTAPNAVPGLGSVLPLQLSALPGPPGGVYLGFGLTITNWNGASLPADLANLGMPTCLAWAAMTHGIVVAHAGSSASVPLAIPNDPVLAGAQVALQALVLDLGAPNGVGVVSNALALRLF